MASIPFEIVLPKPSVDSLLSLRPQASPPSEESESFERQLRDADPPPAAAAESCESPERRDQERCQEEDTHAAETSATSEVRENDG